MPIFPNELSLIVLGACAGGCAGLLAGLLGIGGGVVIVPVVFYGLVASHMAPDLAAHVAVSTSLAAILPAALVSSFTHWRGGNADIDFLRRVLEAQAKAPERPLLSECPGLSAPEQHGRASRR
jgi:uncharacterized protein